MVCSRCKKRPATVFITRMEGDKTVNDGLCLICAKELGIKPVCDIIDRFGMSDEDLESVDEQLTGMMQEAEDDGDGEDFKPGGAATFPFLQNIFPNMRPPEGAAPENGGAKGGEQRGGKKSKRNSALEQYCTDLTARARAGEIGRIIGRERELYRVTQILCRRTKNNPCLIGEPGVGKTAIAEGLALRIARGEAPARLMEKEIHLLDLTALVAGTQFRGQFESRIKALVDEVKAKGNVILFIDEIHNLVGTGDAEGSMSAANILKPALSRGEIQVIGATTFNEYRKHIEKDAALERRFQPVTVEEPSVAEATAILSGVKDYYEQFHGVKVSDAMVQRAVTLSERYITDRFLPDKAIDLLDEAAAAAALENKAADSYAAFKKELSRLQAEEQRLMAADEVDYESLANLHADMLKTEQNCEQLRPAATEKPLEERHLAKVIELWTGIPAAKVQQSELAHLSGMEERLSAHVIGQDEAVGLVAAAIRRHRVQISPRRRPASFLFVGPTGVGKTELVKVLARDLFDTPEALIRLDMSEFMEKHAVSRIIGSPPGYVGYDEAGQLTEKVRRKPYSVLLFDEIEKAHPDVLNILLQILDEGRVTDAHGRTVNFENTVLVMTSNAGSDTSGALMGFGRSGEQAGRDKALKALREFLRPEFLSRVDEVVYFRPLSEPDYVRIAGLLLEELKAPLAEHGITFGWTPAVEQKLAAGAVGGTRGARDLRTAIRREVEDRIAVLLVQRCDTPPTAISVDVSEAGAITVTAV